MLAFSQIAALGNAITISAAASLATYSPGEHGHGSFLPPTPASAPDSSSICALLIESPRLSVIPLAVVIRTTKQTFEEAGASLGLGIVIVP